MSKNELVYNPEHMDKISLSFNKCADYSNHAMGNLEKIKASFSENYEGQASNMANDLYSKIKEHIELLNNCLSQMESYVKYSKETMIELDQKLATKDSIKKGGEK